MTDPLVVVYWRDPDDSTGAFLGYGSLLTSAIVVLHPPPTHLSQGANPAFAAASTPAAAEDRLPVRCQLIPHAGTHMAIDGYYASAPVPLAPPSVTLSSSWPGAYTDLDLDDGELPLTGLDLARAAGLAAVAAGQDDPASPPLPPPISAEIGGPIVLDDDPVGKPWYCAFISHGPGC